MKKLVIVIAAIFAMQSALAKPMKCIDVMNDILSKKNHQVVVSEVLMLEKGGFTCGKHGDTYIMVMDKPKKQHNYGTAVYTDKPPKQVNNEVCSGATDYSRCILDYMYYVEEYPRVMWYDINSRNFTQLVNNIGKRGGDWVYITPERHERAIRQNAGFWWYYIEGLTMQQMEESRKQALRDLRSKK